MAAVRLTRLETGNQGTFGRLTARGIAFFSGELPWRDNASNVSCIPAGTYRCVWSYSPRFRRLMYLVEGVRDRSGVRFHSANLMGDVARKYLSQLNGCIALGERMGWIDGQKAVLMSAPATRRFESLMAGKPFTLEIVDA